MGWAAAIQNVEVGKDRGPESQSNPLKKNLRSRGGNDLLKVTKLMSLDQIPGLQMVGLVLFRPH